MANGAGKLHTARVTDAPDFEKALKVGKDSSVERMSICFGSCLYKR